jgi:dTDP-glucose 4,6-dehydratase
MFLSSNEDLSLISSSLEAEVLLLRGKKIFLSGATGFIGKNLLEALLSLNSRYHLGMEIYSVSRNPQTFFRQYPHFSSFKELKLYQHDIKDDLASLPISDVDFVIHAATDVSQQNNPVDLFQDALLGTENLIGFAKKWGCQEFLLLSSGAVYGRQPENLEKIPEEFIGGVDLTSGGSAYALGKMTSEWLLLQRASEEMNVKIARCFAFYGPYLPLDKHFAIGNFVAAAVKSHDIVISGDGTPLRTYLYTADLSVWLIKILLHGEAKTVWNVGGGTAISILELANKVRHILNPAISIKVMGKRSGRIEKYVPDIAKVTGELNLKASVLLEDGIIRMANWNRVHGNFQ